MQRDWDLIRAILDQAADKPPGKSLDANEVKGFEHALVAGHIEMLHDAGYLEARLLPSGTGAGIASALVKKVTMEGYDLLNTLKSPPVWERIKKMAKEKGLDLTFELVKQLSVIALKQIFKSDSDD